MKPTSSSLSEYVSILGSKAPAPGGGSASSLEGALGAALIVMVCDLTLGKEKYKEYEQLVLNSKITAQKIQNQLLEMCDADVTAFSEMEKVFKIPKENPARQKEMQRALKICVNPPFETLKLCAEAIELIEPLLGKTNKGAVSDLGCAAKALSSAMKNAWLNVLININSMEDEEIAFEFKHKGQALLDEYIPLSDKIYKKVEEVL